MVLSDILYYVIGYGLLAMAAITLWVVMTPGQTLFIG